MLDPEPRSIARNSRVPGLVVFLATLTLASVGASSARAQSDSALRLLAQAVEASEVLQDEWPFEELDAAVQVAVRRAVLDGDAPAAVKLLAAGEGAGDEETARALLWAALSVMEDPFPYDCEEASVPPEVEAALLSAVVAPNPSAAVVSTFGRLLGERWDCPVGVRVVRSLAEHRAVDVAAAWAPDNHALLELVFSLEGATPRVLLIQAESLYGIERAAALELARKQLLLRGEPAPEALGHERLEALLDAGFAASALSVWSEVGDEALDGAGDSDEPQVSRKLDLAAAAILEGRPELARALLSRPAQTEHLPPDATSEQHQETEVDELSARLRQALELSIEGAGSGAAADPFDLLAELALQAEAIDGYLGSRSTLLRFLGVLSDELAYPAFAGAFKEDMEGMTRWARASLENPGSEVVRSLADEVRLLLREVAPDADATLQVEPSLPHMAGDEPLPAGFRVRPLRDEELVDPDGSGAAIQAPSGFGMVRAERSPELDVVLATSQAIDPVGEVSPGGYWILLSPDGGASWQAWPTGLRVGSPYEAVAESRRPLLTEDGVAIEVRWAKIDRGSITFPPIGLAVERREDPLVIEVPWAVLRADHDSDGLSDLYEERLFTDPERADTDGDGVTDFDDPLPGVAYSAAGSPASDALDALLGRIGDDEQRAILPRCPGGRPGLCFSSSSPGLERVLFVVGDPEDWRGLAASRRTVVLSPEEHRAAEARWGPIYATRFPLIAVDRSGTRAVIIWSRSWQGGAALLERNANGWVVHIRSSWIT